MKAFRYAAIDAQGRTVRGVQNAASEQELGDRLARLGLELLRAREASRRFTRPRSLRTRELVNVLIHVRTLSAAGVPLIEALQDLREASDSGVVQGFAADVLDRIMAGATFSEALAQSPWPVDEVVVSLVRTGEVTGQLPEVLAGIVENLKWTDELNAQTRKLLRAPAVTGTVVLMAVLFLMIYLVPQLLVFIRGLGGELPLQTVALMWTSATLRTHGWLVIAAPAATVLLLKAAARRSPALRERVDGWKLRARPIGPILKKVLLARFATSFALMYRSGVPVMEALGYCRGLSSNFAYQRAIERAREQIAQGTKISDAFAAAQMFPPLVVRMLRIGENTGGLDESLGHVSYFYRREVDEAIDRLQGAIQPTLTVFLGAMVAWILASVILPIYDVIAKVKF